MTFERSPGIPPDLRLAALEAIFFTMNLWGLPRENLRSLMNREEISPLVARLQQEMQEAADALNFERAAQIRDQFRAIEHIVEKQKVVSLAGGDQDVVAFAREDGDTCVQMFFIRQGKLIEEVVQLLRVCYRTVQNGLNGYRHGGLEEGVQRGVDRAAVAHTGLT